MRLPILCRNATFSPQTEQSDCKNPIETNKGIDEKSNYEYEILLMLRILVCGPNKCVCQSSVCHFQI